MMVVIAFVALGLEGWQLKRSHDRLLGKAARHRSMEQYCKQLAELSHVDVEQYERAGLKPPESRTAFTSVPGSAIPEEFTTRPRNEAEWVEAANYYAAMARKYERAASRPWRTVPADPPAPN